jgi:hypothetical protein
LFVSINFVFRPQASLFRRKFFAAWKAGEGESLYSETGVSEQLYFISAVIYIFHISCCSIAVFNFDNFGFIFDFPIEQKMRNTALEWFYCRFLVVSILSVTFKNEAFRTFDTVCIASALRARFAPPPIPCAPESFARPHGRPAASRNLILYSNGKCNSPAAAQKQAGALPQGRPAPKK